MSYGLTYFAVVDADTADDAERPDEIICRPQSGSEADDLDNRVGPPPLGHLQDPPAHAFRVRHEVQGLGAQAAGQLEAALDAVDGEQVPGLVLERGNDGAQPDGTAPYHDHGGVRGPLRLDPPEGIPRAEEPGGEDVAHEDQRAVVHLGRRLDGGAVRQRHPDVLCLAAVELGAAEKQAVGAASRGSELAVEAFAAYSCQQVCCFEIFFFPPAGLVPRCGEGDDHLVSDLEGLDCRACLDYLARELVAHDEAGSGMGIKTTVRVEFAVRGARLVRRPRPAGWIRGGDY